MNEKSYRDWKAEIVAQNEEVEEEDVEAAREKARNILKNFKP